MGAGGRFVNVFLIKRNDRSGLGEKKSQYLPAQSHKYTHTVEGRAEVLKPQGLSATALPDVLYTTQEEEKM